MTRTTFSIIALGLSTVRWLYSQDCKGILNKFEQMNLKGKAGMVMVF